jgi:hypothetical protein
MGLHEIKMLLHKKEMVFKLNRLPIEWEKIFVSYPSDKELITRIHKELKKLNSQNINDPMEIPRWRLVVGSRKRASYSEILERCQRHTLQA